MARLPKTVYHAGDLGGNPGVTFTTVRRRDAEEWSAASDGVPVHTITLTCRKPASVEDVKAAAEALGLTERDFEDITPYGNDPDYSPFDWLYDACVRDELVRLGFDCAAGSDFMFNEDVPVVALWIPGTFKFEASMLKELRTFVHAVLECHAWADVR